MWMMMTRGRERQKDAWNSQTPKNTDMSSQHVESIYLAGHLVHSWAKLCRHKSATLSLPGQWRGWSVVLMDIEIRLMFVIWVCQMTTFQKKMHPPVFEINLGCPVTAWATKARYPVTLPKFQYPSFTHLVLIDKTLHKSVLTQCVVLQIECMIYAFLWWQCHSDWTCPVQF